MKNHKKLEILLWKKLKQGSTSALGDLYDQYIDILFSYGIQLSGDKDHVMNCIHDLFIDLYKYKSNLAETDNIKYYLFKSLKRKIFKKNNSLLVLKKEESTSNYTLKNKNFRQSIEQDLIDAEIVQERSIKLAEALSSLTSRQRNVLFLRFNEDKSYEEISLILNISVQSSRTIIYRAIKKLRFLLKILVFYVINLFF